MVRRTLVLFLLTLLSYDTFGAACCGGGSSLPNLISGDYLAKITLGASNKGITDDVSDEGVVSSRYNDLEEVSEGLYLEGAALLSPMWQLGMGIDYKINHKTYSVSKESSSGIGDVSSILAYEFLPELSFSKWKPRGFVFLDLKFPIGKSIYESNETLQTNALSKGFITPGIGISFVKITSSFDFLLVGHIDKALPRDFEGYGEIEPGVAIRSLFGMGYSFEKPELRLGTSVEYLFEDGKKISNINKSSSKKLWTLGINLSYQWSEFGASLNYSDESFFPGSKNSILGKSIGVSLTKFFLL